MGVHNQHTYYMWYHHYNPTTRMHVSVDITVVTIVSMIMITMIVMIVVIVLDDGVGVVGGVVRVGRIVGMMVVVTIMSLASPLHRVAAQIQATDASVDVTHQYQRTYVNPPVPNAYPPVLTSKAPYPHRRKYRVGIDLGRIRDHGWVSTGQGREGSNCHQ